jgi:NADH-quinone oxidoreductase subunit M
MSRICSFVISFVVALVVFVGLHGPAVARADATGAGLRVLDERGAPLGSPLAIMPGAPRRIALENAGPSAIQVTSLYARTTEAERRMPGALAATAEGGAAKFTLASGERRPIVVRWDRAGARGVGLFGHLVIESDDRVAQQIAVPVVADPHGGLGAHLGSAIVGAPFLGLLVVLALIASRRVDRKTTRWVALVAVCVQAALVLFLVRAFDPALGRDDGNDGLQFVERAVLLRSVGVEWALGIDGLGLPLLGSASVLSIGAVVAAFRVERETGGQQAAILAFSAAAHGLILAIDGALFCAFLAAAIGSAWALITGDGSPPRRRAATVYAMAGAVAVATIAFVLVRLSKAAPSSFLIDGTRAHGFLLGELARVDFVELAGEGRLFGLPFVAGAFVALLLASMLLLPVAPLHGPTSRALSEADGPATLLLFGVGTRLGLLVLLRLALPLLPQGARWASPSLAFLGAASIVWAGLVALGAGDLRRAVAQLGVAHGGLVLLGIAAGTPQAISGLVVEGALGGCALAAAGFAACLVPERLQIRAFARLGGIAVDAPLLAIVAAAAFVAAGCAPGLAGFVGPFLILVGSFPLHRGATLLAGVGLLVVFAAALVAFARIFLGPFAGRLRESPYLEAHGGVVPDLDRRERIVAIGLLAIALVLGLAPRTIIDLGRNGAQDLGARVAPEGLS